MHQEHIRILAAVDPWLENFFVSNLSGFWWQSFPYPEGSTREASPSHAGHGIFSHVLLSWDGHSVPTAVLRTSVVVRLSFVSLASVSGICADSILSLNRQQQRARPAPIRPGGVRSVVPRLRHRANKSLLSGRTLAPDN